MIKPEQNWAIIVTYNNLQLSIAAIESLRAQTIPTDILVIDNDSTDGTWDWLKTQNDLFVRVNHPQRGVAGAWNQALKWVFNSRRQEHALVINNDVRLRPDTYHHLLQDGGGFVTAVGSDDENKIMQPGLYTDAGVLEAGMPFADPDPSKKRPHPDFSCFMIRRHVYEIVGPFNESFEGAYCEDSDYHIRMHRAGIKAESLDLAFLHVEGGAQAVKNADPKSQRKIQIQADKNRALFRRLYGFDVGSEEYYQEFGSNQPTDYWADGPIRALGTGSVPESDPGSQSC